MSAWDDLVTTALLGTERRQLPQALPGAVDRLVAAQGDRGLAVLDAAAGYATYLAAGARPGTAPGPPLAPRQILDPAPQPSQELLATLLGGRDVALVDDWLRACTARGLAARPGLWASLATAAAVPGGVDRGLVRAALGERGRAFLALNPRWRVVARSDVGARAPSRTRDAEDPAWSEGLSAQVPAAVQLTGSLGRRRLTLAPDPTLVRQTLAGADLDAWQRHTGLAPEAFLGLLRQGAGDRVGDVVAALADATRAQAHVAWATALVGAGYARSDLVESVPADAWDGIVRGWVAGRRDPDQVAVLLTAVPGPWDDTVGDAALRHLTGGRVGPATCRRTLPVVALRLPLSALRVVSRHAEVEHDRGDDRGFTEAERVLGLRADIDRTFARVSQETP